MGWLWQHHPFTVRELQAKLEKITALPEGQRLAVPLSRPVRRRVASLKNEGFEFASG